MMLIPNIELNPLRRPIEERKDAKDIGILLFVFLSKSKNPKFTPLSETGWYSPLRPKSCA